MLVHEIKSKMFPPNTDQDKVMVKNFSLIQNLKNKLTIRDKRRKGDKSRF